MKEKSKNDIKGPKEFLEEISKYIQELPLDDGTRSMFVSDLIFEAMNWGSHNFYEALGIAEAAKQSYIRAFEETMIAEANEEENKKFSKN